MTKGAALNSFFNSFGINAYPDTGTPKDAKFPYITYSVVFGAYPDTSTIMNVNVWYNTYSEKDINDKVQEMSVALGHRTMINVDGGILVLSRGSPFSQSMVADDSGSIKRRYVIVLAEWYTEY